MQFNKTPFWNVLITFRVYCLNFSPFIRHQCLLLGPFGSILKCKCTYSQTPLHICMGMSFTNEFKCIVW